MRGRQIAERAWEWLGAEKRLTELIIAFLVLHILILVIPQSPIPTTADPTFTRWLAELPPTLGAWRALLAALSFFTLRTSLWMRGALMASGLILVIRLADLGEHWAEWSRGWRWRQVGIIAGGVLFIGGWGAYMVWGWAEPDLIAWPQAPLAIAERGLTLPEPHFPLLTRHYGVYLIPQGQTPGVEVRAFTIPPQGGAPSSLALSRTARSAPEETLRWAFTPQAPETYFTIPDAELIFRISQSADVNNPSLQLQAYRSASGDLVTEMEFNANQDLVLDEIQVQIQYARLPCLTAIYNPGALFQILGGGLFIGAWLWSYRRKAGETIPPPEIASLADVPLENVDDTQAVATNIVHEM
ncbi:MAG TPA: hypothetical protein PKH77_09230 [Anaerolineae bacterium]|nr:hypothetical protein [Anaerolineae bacterium]